MESVEDAVQTLVGMGFSEEASRAALSAVDPPTVDAAMEYLVANEGAGSGESMEDGSAEAVKSVRSYRCVDTGKLFRTMQDAQLYAERTGHANFEESDQEVPPMTEEEKQEKLQQIRERLKQKRAEREEKEKVDEVQQELSRRKAGQEMAEMREEREKMLREQAYDQRRKEKEAFKREKDRLKMELAKDKAERAADAARRRGETPEQVKKAADNAWNKAMGLGVPEEQSARTNESSQEMMDKSIHDLSQYKAGGDGLRALKTLRKMVENIVANPDEPKFKQINLQNEAFKKRVASLVGGVSFLRACGFSKDSLDQKLNLEDSNLNIELLKHALSRLDAEIESSS